MFEIDNFTVPVCDCGSYYDGKWEKPKETNKIIKEMIEKRMKTSSRIIKEKISLKKIGNRIIVSITCYGFIRPCKKMKKEAKRITITLKKRKCDVCTKLSGGYYEAVLQVRGDYENIFNLVKKYLPKTARIEKLRRGYDIRFLKKSDAAKAAKNLRGFEIKKSFKFVATKKDKKLYRNYYSVK